MEIWKITNVRNDMDESIIICDSIDQDGDIILFVQKEGEKNMVIAGLSLNNHLIKKINNTCRCTFFEVDNRLVQTEQCDMHKGEKILK